jgi:hypothetical protein
MHHVGDMKNILSAILGVYSLFAAHLALAAEGPQPTGTTPGYSLFTDYTAGAVGIVLLVGVLVTVLLGAGMLFVNLGLMSKRREDHIGRRDPSDVGILKHTVWPQEVDDRRYLPAEEDEEPALASKQPRRDGSVMEAGQTPVGVDSPYHEKAS